MKYKNSISIIIPAYNEVDNLENSVHQAMAAASNSGLKSEIIIVDDASTDGTHKVALKLSKKENIFFFKNYKNLNLGGSYKVGLENANGEYVTWAPADCSHNSEQLSRVYKHIGKADFLIALPDNKFVRPFNRRILSSMFTFLVNLLSGNNIKYYNGLSVYKTSDIKSLSINSNGFSFQAELMCKCLAKGLAFKYCLTSLEEHETRKSKAFNIRNFIQVAVTFLRILELRIASWLQQIAIKTRSSQR